MNAGLKEYSVLRVLNRGTEEVILEVRNGDYLTTAHDGFARCVQSMFVYEGSTEEPEVLFRFLDETSFTLEPLFCGALPERMRERPAVDRSCVAAALKNWNKAGTVTSKIKLALQPQISAIEDVEGVQGETHVMCSYSGFTHEYNRMETISAAKGRGGTAWRKYTSKKKRQEHQLKVDEGRAAKAHEQVQKNAARAAKTLEDTEKRAQHQEKLAATHARLADAQEKSNAARKRRVEADDEKKELYETKKRKMAARGRCVDGDNQLV